VEDRRARLHDPELSSRHPGTSPRLRAGGVPLYAWPVTEPVLPSLPPPQGEVPTKEAEGVEQVHSQSSAPRRRPSHRVAGGTRGACDEQGGLWEWDHDDEVSRRQSGPYQLTDRLSGRCSHLEDHGLAADGAFGLCELVNMHFHDVVHMTTKHGNGSRC
jgi:hypothetical protein